MKIKFFSNGVPDLSGVAIKQAILNKLRTPKSYFQRKRSCPFGAQRRMKIKKCKKGEMERNGERGIISFFGVFSIFISHFIIPEKVISGTREIRYEVESRK